MNGVGATLTVLLCLLVTVLNRRGAVLAIIAAVCYITQGQELNLGIHLTAMRLVLLVGFIRTVVRGELMQIRINRVDVVLAAYVFCMVGVACVRDHSSDNIVYQLGFGYNAVLSYFVLRALLQGQEDVRGVLNGMAIVMIPMALLMIEEGVTGHNWFSIMGGVSDISMIRDDRVRATGAFRIPITAGAFGATFALLYGGALFSGAPRRITLLGLGVSLVIVFCAHSSGPILGLAAGLLAMACWRVRRHTRAIRWGILLTLIGLHMVMKVPVWFLLGRISDLVGGGGYHRAYLIDRFVTYFEYWWKKGISDTSDWMITHLALNSQADLTNEFIANGVNAGLAAVIISILVLVCCFQAIGRRMDEIADGEDPETERFLWTMGSTLVGAIAILFSVSYFDQIHVVWYFQLAAICACAYDPESRAASEADESGDEEVEVENVNWLGARTI